MPSASAQNRLGTQTSPYLLQHKDNPVDWWPWGPEALDEARRSQKPIFLSVGYSTCYWCHVMERESFEDPEVAQVLNERFINIKVDREERPDIDTIYMTAVQLFNEGQGGWPMSVWLTPPGARDENDPGLEPIFAGTYFPRQAMAGRPAFPELAKQIHAAWQVQREEVIDQASRAGAAVRATLSEREEPVRVDSSTAARALQTLLSVHDRDHGGFGSAPKFPQPVYLEFLLDILPAITDPAARSAAATAVRTTLDKMALGGINDHLAGGFHRYSTDQTWTVPHFEKMLYDQAQLLSIYSRHAAFTNDPLDRRTARRTADFVLERMTGPAGGFYSAIDAEVDGKEGFNYLWLPEQFDSALSADDASFAKRVFGLEGGTNFQDPHHPDEPRRNVLVLQDRPERLAERMSMSESDFLERLDRVAAKLLEVRDRRQQPSVDDKIVVAWNGMMIEALCNAAITLSEPRYLDAARRAAGFVLDSMGDGEGGVLRIYRDGSSSTEAFLEDYASLISGLIALHRVESATSKPDLRWLKAAETLTVEVDRRFAGSRGALHDTQRNQPDLLVRASSSYDGAVPSASSVMLHNYLELYDLTREEKYFERAFSLLETMSHDIREAPAGTINSVRSVLRMLREKPGFPSRLPAPKEDEAGGSAGGDIDVDHRLQVFAAENRVRVTEREGELSLRLRIDEGWHVSAFEPGTDAAVPLELRVEGGEGVAVRVEAPEPSTLTVAGEPIAVYAGEVELKVHVKRDGREEWAGRPMLVIRYQACNDRMCMPPQELSLDIALDRGF